MRPLFIIDHKTLTSSPFIFEWQPQGMFVAASGGDRIAHLFDRQGNSVDDVSLEPSGVCTALEWDCDGEILAIAQSNSGVVHLWDSNSRRVMTVDTNMRDISLLKWSRTGPQLAIGTGKGNLLLYNKRSLKKTVLLGKHTKRITCGAWNLENKLGLGSEDRTFTISGPTGETLFQGVLKYEPSQAAWSDSHEDGRERDTMLSLNTGHKSLFLHTMDDPDPIELTFQAQYGSIADYKWFGDGYVLVGFTNGYLVIVSTHPNEIGTELFCEQLHSDGLIGLAYSSELCKVATCGQVAVKVVDLSGWTQRGTAGLPCETLPLETARGQPQRVAFSKDGQILTVATKTGNLICFLANLPVLNAARGTQYMRLTSLQEVTVSDMCAPPNSKSNRLINIELEPSFLALGTSHVCLGMNNSVWFYRIKDAVLVSQRDYVASVQSCSLNEVYAAILSEGRVHLHFIEEKESAREARTFPDRDGDVILCMYLTNTFLIYGTQQGYVTYYSIADGTTVAEHDRPVEFLTAHESETRILFMDDAQNGFLYSPVEDQVLPIKELPPNTVALLFDQHDTGVFVAVELAANTTSLHTFVFVPLTFKGPTMQCIGQTALPYRDHKVILVSNGVALIHLANGTIVTHVLSSHEFVGCPLPALSSGSLPAVFEKYCDLWRLSDAWRAVQLLADEASMKALGRKALECLDIDMAVVAYREAGDIGMVMALEKLVGIEERNLLSGQVAKLLGDWSTAQELFLVSSCPAAALDMRIDLHHWDHALTLAKTLAPHRIPALSRSHAQEQELQGKYKMALQLFQHGLSGDPNDEVSYGGVARCHLRLGDVKQGVNMALKSERKALIKECAFILEAMQQWSDAALLYQKSGQFDKAAEIYINTKNLAQAGPLMDKVVQRKLHVSYAKAMEAHGNFEEAAREFQAAGDLAAVVRLYLDSLRRPEKAFQLVRETRTPDGAVLVSRFCQRIGDFRTAIEFLLMASRATEAFALAQEHDQMEAYVSALGTQGSADEYLKVARFHETHRQLDKAAEYYALCGENDKAVTLLLEEGEAGLDRAIDVVSKARDEKLTTMLVDYVTGKTDGVPKDRRYAFRLYMVTGDYIEAGKVAVEIAQERQATGKYKEAHGILLETYQKLESQRIRPPMELRRTLMLLHSYVLVKILAKIGDHRTAARILIRLAKNVSKFPEHIVPILTSTVFECRKADLRRSAFEYASMLMHPEYREHIPAQYRRKVEMIVRRPEKSEEDEPMTPCCYCNTLLVETQLDCPSCKNTLPYCIATGRHMIREEWSTCPRCHFPALYDPFIALLGVTGRCPLCNETVPAGEIARLTTGIPPP